MKNLPITLSLAALSLSAAVSTASAQPSNTEAPASTSGHVVVISTASAVSYTRCHVPKSLQVPISERTGARAAMAQLRSAATVRPPWIELTTPRASAATARPRPPTSPHSRICRMPRSA